ncbi:MAG: L,D-transpeptidase family protein [Planctomycetota bacterium]
MSKRRSGKRRNGEGKGRWVALGVAGALSLGFVVTRGSGGEEAPVALSTTPASTDPADGTAKAPEAPAELVASLERLGEEGIHPILDLRRLVVEFGDSEPAGRARAALAAEAERQLAAARAAKGQDPSGALVAMTRAYLATLDSAARRKLRPEAEALSAAAVAAPGCPLVKTHQVKPGEVLSRIARHAGTDYRLIKRLSGMSRDFLKVGQQLKLPAVPSEVVIFKRDFELVVLLGGHLLRAFDVATGKSGRTPEGRFDIGTKQVDPTWYSPDGKVYPFGSEGNILGTRWLAFVDTPEHKGFGIHGTKFPESIGTEASMGCIRMRNAEVEVVYDLIPSGSKVRIQK